MNKQEKTSNWTRWMRMDELQRASIILGMTNDAEKGSKFEISKLLKEGIASKRVEKRKEGNAQSSPAYYRAKKGE
jgi:hypothetical protein